MDGDAILIRGLRLSCRIGVPDDERAVPQEVLADIRIVPMEAFRAMADDVTRTVDYAAVCLRLEAVAAERPRQLIETLAADLADSIAAGFACRNVTVEIRKFILPTTEWVGVRHSRAGLAGMR